MYYDELVLEALFREGIIDEDLYEKCKTKYVITFDDIQGIKMSIDGTIKQIKSHRSEFEKFQDELMGIHKFTDPDDIPPAMDVPSVNEERRRFYETWKKQVEEYNKKSNEHEDNLKNLLGDWYDSLRETLNKSDSREWENKSVDVIDNWKSDIKDHRKAVNGIPVLKSWDNKNKTKYLKYLSDLEELLDKVRKRIRKG